MEKTRVIRRFPPHWSDEEESLLHEGAEDVEDIDSLTQPIERPLAGKFFIFFKTQFAFLAFVIYFYLKYNV